MRRIADRQPPLNQTAAMHFSHPHPLSLCNNPPPQTQNNPSSYCSGCRLPLSGPVYSCTVCNYFLHEKCYKIPKNITHPCHREHRLSLLPYPAYADGIFICDACGENGEGFSYHCKPCRIDLHIMCAVTPLTVLHPSHPHKLHLTFSVPYFNKKFICNICELRGSNHWLYRCESCGFDAHLKCATTAPIHRPHTHHHHPQPATPYFVPHPQPAWPPVINNMAGVGVPLGNPTPPNIQMQQNMMILQMMQEGVETGSAIVQSILSEGGGNAYAAMGGNNTYQQLMQSDSNLYANGVLDGSTGDEYIQALMNGGGDDFTCSNPLGGGTEAEDYYLQALMNGGGAEVGGGIPGLDALGDADGGSLEFLSFDALDDADGGVLDFLCEAFVGFDL